MQLEGDFSDIQMRLIARVMRDKTECPHIIEQFFEKAVVQSHKAVAA